MNRFLARGFWGRALYISALFCFLLLGRVPVAIAANATASWDPNPETDIAGYVLSWGTTSGVYPNSVDVGNVTSYIVTGLTSGQQYFFVVKAYNTSGLYSSNSAQVAFTVPVAAVISSISPNTGPIGTPVTISGSGFGSSQGSSTVKFNGTTATPTSWSSTSIVAPVPVGATTGPVVVTIGGTASNGLTFTVNNPPTLGAISNKTNAENTAVSVQLVGSDPDGNPLTYSATNLPPGLSVNASTGLISGTLTFSSAGTYNVTATVTDGALSASRNFTWTVTNVNRAPTLNSISNRTNAENTAVSLQLVGSDPDGDTLTYSATNLPGGLSVNSSTGLISGTLSFSSAGTYNVTATVSDGSLTASRSFTWTVTNVDRAPTLNSVPNQTNAENATVSLQLVGSDPDGDTLTYSATNLPGGLSVNSATGLISGTLSSTSAGTYNVTATVTANALTASRNFTWTVTDVNNAPTLSFISNRTNAENDIVSSQLVGSDPDGDTLIYGATNLPAGLSVNGSTGLVSGTLTYSSAGTYNVTATVSDGSLSATRNFTWTVTNVNRAPTLSGPGSPSIDEHAPAAIQLAGVDPDGDPVSFSASGLPQGLSIDAGTGLISGRAFYTAAGVYTVQVTCTDGSLSASTSFSLTVVDRPSPLNRANDFDGDGRTDYALYEPSGLWRVLHSSSNNSTSDQLAWGLNTDRPVPGDYDGDGRADAAVFRPSTGTWFILTSGSGYVQSRTVVHGQSTDRPVPGDYDGDGRDDVAVYHPSSATWEILESSTNYATTQSFTFGGPGDAPMPGDFDGDGQTDLAVYKQSGLWSIRTSSSGYATTTSFAWGLVTDRPVPGDYDGDGRQDLAIYRPSTATWHVLVSGANYTTSFSVGLGAPGARLVPGDYDGDGRTDLAVYQPADGVWQVLPSTTDYANVQSLTWGGSTDRPIPFIVGATSAFGAGSASRSDSIRAGDFDGDLKSDLTIYRPSTGQWYSLASGTGFTTSTILSFGNPTDTPVPGDYDGDGQADIATYRQSGLWSIRLSTSGYAAVLQMPWGLSTDVPVPGDYDGDGRTDIAIFRPSTGTWYVLKSGSEFTQSMIVSWGSAGDKPVPADFDGDGKADLAVYSPLGMWSILTSGSSYTTSMSMAWGVGTEVPVPGDYDGDGRADAAIFRPSTATWDVLKSSSGYTTSTSFVFGSGANVAVPSDYDGDGKTDLTVYYPSGLWSVALSTTDYASGFSIGWGLGTDIPINGRR